MRSIMSTPLQTIAPEQDVREWFARHEGVGFDCAPVEEKRRIIGMVAVDAMKQVSGPIAAGDLMEPLPRVPMVAESETIANLIRAMRGTGRHFWLVLTGTKIDGIVTRSDLWKLPVRLLAMAMLVHVEQLITELIRRDRPSETWLAQLNKPTRLNIERRGKRKRALNENLDLIETTMFSEKVQIVRLALRNEQLAADLGELVELRNLLMHARDGDDESAGVDDLLTNMERLENVIEYANQLLLLHGGNDAQSGARN